MISPTRPTDEIRIAETTDLPYLTTRIDQHRHELGFWPFAMVIDAVQQKRVTILTYNGDPAAFLIRGPKCHVQKLYAAFTAEEARLNDYCRALVTKMVNDAADEGAEKIRLHTAEDLPANLVWPQLEFRRAPQPERPGQRGRRLLRWELLFPTGHDLEAYLDRQTANPTKKRLLEKFGMEQQFRAAFTRRYRRGQR